MPRRFSLWDNRLTGLAGRTHFFGVARVAKEERLRKPASLGISTWFPRGVAHREIAGIADDILARSFYPEPRHVTVRRYLNWLFHLSELDTR